MIHKTLLYLDGPQEANCCNNCKVIAITVTVLQYTDY